MPADEVDKARNLAPYEEYDQFVGIATRAAMEQGVGAVRVTQHLRRLGRPPGFDLSVILYSIENMTGLLLSSSCSFRRVFFQQ